MTAKPEVVVNPIFYDALSETFRPPTDGINRDHNLGRLAIATLTKGEVITTSHAQESTGLITYGYIPSWAEMVKAEVTCESDGGHLPLLSTVRLESGEHALDIVDLSFCEIPQVGISEDDEEEFSRMPIRLGDELLIARLTIASIAQNFFNRLAR